MSPRAIRLSGTESVESRARRLAEDTVGAACAAAERDGLFLDVTREELVAFFVCGYMAAVRDTCEVPDVAG